MPCVFFMSVPNVKISKAAGYWWLSPIILATQEVGIRRIVVQRQPGQIVFETLSQKNPSTTTTKKSGGVAQVVDPEFKGTQYRKKKKKKIPKATVPLPAPPTRDLVLMDLKPQDLAFSLCFNFTE
jgi:hypothetical protein